jgi:two-component system cell cycle response regulator DivK
MFMNWRLKTVLIAEDEDANFMLLEEYLESTGIQIIRANNGQEVVDICREKLPDLILMDMRMPIKTGYEAVAELRSLNILVPIIAQTAYRMVGDKDKVIKEGCNDFIYKPLDESDLLKKMSKFLSE